MERREAWPSNSLGAGTSCEGMDITAGEMSLEEKEQRNRYHLIEAFKPILTSVLKPTQIMQHMSQHIDHTEMGKLFMLENTKSTPAAAEYFLDYLLRTNKLGWFTSFKHALKENKYDVLLQCLEGERDIGDQTFYAEMMKIFCVKFKAIDPVALLPRLYEKDCIVLEEKQQIAAAQRDDRQRAIYLLTDALLRHNEDWFIVLLEALREEGPAEVAEAIIPELKEAGYKEDDLKRLVIKTAKKNMGRCTENDEYESDPKKMAKMEEEAMEEEDPGTTLVHDVAYSEEADKSHLFKSENVNNPSSERSVPGADATDKGKVIYSRTPIKSFGTSDSHINDLNSPQHQVGKMQKDKVEDDLTAVMTLGPPDTDAATQAMDSSDEDCNIPPDQPREINQEPIIPRVLELREYQKELAAEALQGKNVIIAAPTGSGKTHVAMKIAQEHFEKADAEQEPKVLFVVPITTLVEQQTRQFKTYLSKHKIRGIWGESSQAPFDKLIESHDVLVVTPQLVTNAIKYKQVTSMGCFSLIILDECHHANKEHPYAVLMMHYLKEKTNLEMHNLPQIVGLTASVGVGKAKSEEGAVNHILRLCANIDAEEVCIVEKNKLELRRYHKRPDEESAEVRGREYDPFKSKISQIMEEIERKMKSEPGLDSSTDLRLFATKYLSPPPERGAQPYSNWVGNLKKPIAEIFEQRVRRVFAACYKELDIYSRGLMLNDDCEMIDALEFIDKEFSNIRRVDANETDAWLESLYRGVKPSLESLSTDERYNKNPKLEKVKEMVLQHIQENSDLRAMLFCKTREMARSICNWMTRDKHLAFLKPKCLVGAHASFDRAGMTQCQQDEVLQEFHKGECKMLVATSVAEEGLDVEKCDCVFRYESVTNEIAMVQARGRVRKEKAVFVTIGGQGRGTVEKEELNRIRERLMQQALQQIKKLSKSLYVEKITQYQEGSLNEWQANQMRARLKFSPHHRLAEDYELRCFKCNQFACFLNEIRIINESYHVVIDLGLVQRIHTEPHPRPYKFGEVKKENKLYCKVCRHDWGIEILYKKALFSVIKIVSFVVIDSQEKSKTYKKWKDVPYGIASLTEEEIRRYGHERSALEEEMLRQQQQDY